MFMKQLIYADNAATTKLDSEAFEAMKPYLLEEYGNPSQPYSFSRSAKKALSDARETIASCINADSDEIFFTSGGTESDNWAIKGIAYAFPEKKRIITTPIEHHAILNSCDVLNKQGFDVDYLQVDHEGIVGQFDLLNKLGQGATSLVSVMMANNEIGTIQNISELAKIVHNHNVLFHTDAVQALGHIKVDVKRMGVDLLSASAHKFNGPRGIGFLYVKKGTNILPYMNGGSQEKSMRAGTENVAGIVGMAVALKKNVDSLEQNCKHLLNLEERIIGQLNASGIDYIRNGSESHLPGLINLSFKGFDGEAILHRLDLMGISISTGAACDARITQISHVLKAIGLDAAYAKGAIRISFGKDNTIDEVDKIVELLIKVSSEASTKKQNS